MCLGCLNKGEWNLGGGGCMRCTGLNIYQQKLTFVAYTLWERRREWVRAAVEKFFCTSQQGRNGKEKSKEAKQRASYARWPPTASAVNTTNRYRITSDTTEKDKNMQHSRAPGHFPDGRAPVVCTASPPPQSRRVGIGLWNWTVLKSYRYLSVSL
jgi:hypothetical protein